MRAILSGIDDSAARNVRLCYLLYTVALFIILISAFLGRGKSISTTDLIFLASALPVVLVGPVAAFLFVGREIIGCQEGKVFGAPAGIVGIFGYLRYLLGNPEYSINVKDIRSIEVRASRAGILEADIEGPIDIRIPKYASDRILILEQLSIECGTHVKWSLQDAFWPTTRTLTNLEARELFRGCP